MIRQFICQTLIIRGRFHVDYDTGNIAFGNFIRNLVRFLQRRGVSHSHVAGAVCKNDQQRHHFRMQYRFALQDLLCQCQPG